MARIIARADGAAPGGTVSDWRSSAARLEQGLPTRSQAATILLNARAQARAIIAEAQQMARDVAAAEQRQAWEQGYADGMAQAQQQLAAVMGRLSALIANAAIDHERGLRNLDEEALALALALGRAVIRNEVSIDPDAVLGIARAALAEMSAAAVVSLRVHPDDAEVLRSSLPALGLPATTEVVVVADPTISPGGCLVESGAARVDATIEAQVERLGELLREYLDAA